jgi:hypothetical protein
VPLPVPTISTAKRQLPERYTIKDAQADNPIEASAGTSRAEHPAHDNTSQTAMRNLFENAPN